MSDTVDTVTPDSLNELRVLLVDDDVDQRMVVARLLTKHGIPHPLEAADAEEAISVAGAARPHLIVLDLAMPGRSGYEVLPDLMQAAPGAVVVILSNLPRRRLVGHLQRRGAVGFVEKRVAADRLIGEILMAAALAELARHHVLHLPGELGSMRNGRRFVRELLTDDDADTAADVELLVSELVTNAIIHATSDPRLEVRITPTVVRVEVYDAEPALPSPRDPDGRGPGGRGLHLIDRLASRWSAEPTEGGKVVWFEIDRRR